MNPKELFYCYRKLGSNQLYETCLQWLLQTAVKNIPCARALIALEEGFTGASPRLWEEPTHLRARPSGCHPPIEEYALPPSPQANAFL